MQLHVGMRIENVLVPVDYSECSLAALRTAVNLAEAVGARLDVVHVWDRPMYVTETVTVTQEGHHRSLVDMIRENAEKEMDDFLAGAGLPASITITRRLLSGEPVSTLLAELEGKKYDLVVVGTHGRTGLSHILLGSVAERLVRLSPVPVLAVPNPVVARVDRKAG